MRTALVILMLTGSPGNAFAQPDEHYLVQQQHQTTQPEHLHSHEAAVNPAGQYQAPHVHGVAQLLVALEGSALLLELHSPALNLLGFEHQARTAEQKAQVANAKTRLGDANNLFNTGAARCRIAEHRMDFSAVHDEHSDHSGNHSDDHSADHSKHQHAHDQEKTNHSDITILYHFHCARPEQLQSLATTLPVRFPGIASLEVQWIVHGQQGQATLSADQPQVNFR